MPVIEAQCASILVLTLTVISTMRVRRAPVAESVIRVGGYNLWTVGFHDRDRRVSAT